MIGQRFGLLVVLERAAHVSRMNQAYWVCRCDCGKEAIRFGPALKQLGDANSCGCRKGIRMSNLRPPAATPRPPAQKVRKAIVVNGETVVVDVTVCPPGTVSVGPDWLYTGGGPNAEHRMLLARARDRARERYVRYGTHERDDV